MRRRAIHALVFGCLAGGVALAACGAAQQASSPLAGPPDAQADEDGGAGAGCVLPEASDRDARVAAVEQSMALDIKGFTDQLADDAGAMTCGSSGQGFSVQEFPQAALGLLLLSGDADAGVPTSDAAGQVASAPGDTVRRAEAMARCAFQYQDFSSSAPGSTNGVFAYTPGDSYNLTDNGTEFAAWGLVTLLAAYGSSLSPAFGQLAAPRLQAALTAIEGHAVCPAYTNICLMQIVDLVVGGQYLAQSTDTAAAGQAFVAAGSGLLSQWGLFTADAGVSEYDSPTYAAVDLRVLESGYLFGPASLRSAFQEALDYVWKHVAASTVASRGSLVPPYSRTYDFFYGQGSLRDDLYLEGLAASPLGHPGLLAAFEVANERFSGYRPGPPVLCPAVAPEREVRSTWGTSAATRGKERYLYVTPDFTLGSTSAPYSSSDLISDQDELVGGSLGASPSVPLLSAFGDYFDSPGGQSVASGDFTKVTHLQTSPASAQLRGDLLVSLRVNATDPGYVDSSGNAVPLVNLATDVLLPADADDVIANGQPADLTQGTTLKDAPTVAVRMGAGVLAVSVVDASGLECAASGAPIQEISSPTVELKRLTAATSSSGGVARLVVYHDKTLPTDTSTLNGCWARVALLVRGTSCSGSDPSSCALAFEEQTRAAARAAIVSYDPNTRMYGVRVPPAAAGSPDLYVARILAPDSLVARTVDGGALPFSPLEIDGTKVAY
jgi:hypothetical protein